MNSKAQGLPLNTMIIAILVLVVLVITVVMITKSSSGFNKDAINCEPGRGACMQKSQCEYQVSNFPCPQKGQICCVNFK